MTQSVPHLFFCKAKNHRPPHRLQIHKLLRCTHYLFFMNAGRRLILVVAAALLDHREYVLLAQRPVGKTLAGLWEFPGGKVEIGESPEAALVRELKEELGVQVNIHDLKPTAFASHAYDDFDLLMPLWRTRSWQGEPTAQEGQALAWCAISDLGQFPMPPADLPLISVLQTLQQGDALR
jgi:8-oxo-dGTP diphosphatase